jgi:hypothetical protein
MESVQVAATTTSTTVLLDLAKEFSASSAQSSATKGNVMHLIIRREKRVLKVPSGQIGSA